MKKKEQSLQQKTVKKKSKSNSKFFYLEKKGFNSFTIQTASERLHDILKRNFELVTRVTLPDPELDPLPLGHDPTSHRLPRLQYAHRVVVCQKSDVQFGAV